MLIKFQLSYSQVLKVLQQQQQQQQQQQLEVSVQVVTIGTQI